MVPGRKVWSELENGRLLGGRPGGHIERRMVSVGVHPVLRISLLVALKEGGLPICRV